MMGRIIIRKNQIIEGRAFYRNLQQLENNL